MNITKQPQITFLMSVYNGEKYLSQAIESVFNQTFTDFEFLIINDASTDKTQKIIKSYQDNRIKVITNSTNLGLTKSLNLGLKQANGEYIARLDADDISLPDRLQKQYDFLENNPNVVFVGSLAEIIDENGKFIRIKNKPIDFEIIKFKLLFPFNFYNPFIHSAIFFRKKEILELGGYNENYKYAQDFELYTRIVKKYKMTNLKEYLVQHRLHQDSIWGKIENNTQKEKQSPLQQTVLKAIHAHLNYYLLLTEKEFKIFSSALEHKICSLKDLILVLKIYQKLFKSFIKKENFTKQQIEKILPEYKKNREQMIKWYIKNLLLPLSFGMTLIIICAFFFFVHSLV